MPLHGLYRNVWLTKVERAHVAHWVTYISTRNVSSESATVVIEVQTQGGDKSTEFPRSSLDLNYCNGTMNTTLSSGVCHPFKSPIFTWL